MRSLTHTARLCPWHCKHKGHALSLSLSFSLSLSIYIYISVSFLSYFSHISALSLLHYKSVWHYYSSVSSCCFSSSYSSSYSYYSSSSSSSYSSSYSYYSSDLSLYHYLFFSLPPSVCILLLTYQCLVSPPLLSLYFSIFLFSHSKMKLKLFPPTKTLRTSNPTTRELKTRDNKSNNKRPTNKGEDNRHLYIER